MTLVFAPQAPGERLDETLARALVSWAGLRSLAPLAARRRETIPIYERAEGRRLAPSGTWYCRVELDTERQTHQLGFDARREMGGWRIDAIAEADGLEPVIEWLDRNWSGLDSAVGLFREERLDLTSLYVVERGEHLLALPAREARPDLPEGPIDTAKLLDLIARSLEVDIVELAEGEAPDSP